MFLKAVLVNSGPVPLTNTSLRALLVVRGGMGN
jgi:hypothetical protein